MVQCLIALVYPSNSLGCSLFKWPSPGWCFYPVCVYGVQSYYVATTMRISIYSTPEMSESMFRLWPYRQLPLSLSLLSPQVKGRWLHQEVPGTQKQCHRYVLYSVHMCGWSRLCVVLLALPEMVMLLGWYIPGRELYQLDMLCILFLPHRIYLNSIVLMYFPTDS